jgi:hypothetical protein
MSISLINTGRTEFRAENFSANVLAATTNTVIATITVPTKCRMRLLSLGNYIGTVAAWSQITWRLLCNGIPQAPYNGFLDQIGYAAQRSDVERLEWGGGSIVTVVADNPTAATVATGISMGYELIYQE